MNPYASEPANTPCTRIDTRNEDGPRPACGRSVNSDIERDDLVWENLAHRIHALGSWPLMIVPLYARTFTFALGYLQFPLHRGCQTLESAAWGKRASLSVLLDQPQSRGLTTSASAAYRFEQIG